LTEEPNNYFAAKPRKEMESTRIIPSEVWRTQNYCDQQQYTVAQISEFHKGQSLNHLIQ